MSNALFFYLLGASSVIAAIIAAVLVIRWDAKNHPPLPLDEDDWA